MIGEILEKKRREKAIRESLQIVSENGLSLKNVAAKDEYIVQLTAVRQNGLALKYLIRESSNYCAMSNELQTSKNVVLAAVNQNIEALKYACQFQNDPDVLSLALSKNIDSIKYLDKETFREDHNCKKSVYELMCSVVQTNPLLLKYIPEKYINDELIHIAIKKNVLSLKYINADIDFTDLSILQYALKTDGTLLEYISIPTPNTSDDELRMIRLCRGEDAYKEELRKFQSNGYNHKVDMIDKKAIMDRRLSLITTAVQQNGLALEYVPEEYRTADIVFEAIKHNIGAIRYINDDIIYSRKFILKTLLIVAASGKLSSQEIDEVKDLYESISKTPAEASIKFDDMVKWRKIVNKIINELQQLDKKNTYTKQKQNDIE